MKAAVDEPIREAQMAICVNQQLPRLQRSPMDEAASLSIACYGPSLHDTWKDLQPPILTMSGAHDFLLSRGIVPTYHVDMDPRGHKVAHIRKPHSDVQYLMASVCHPFTWAVLKGYDVKIFHVISGKHTYAWWQQHDPQSLLVIAGSCIGLGAIHIGGVLGYRHFEIHGMDGNFKDGQRHAGKHYGHAQAPITVIAQRRFWQTSKIMHNSNVELINVLHQYPFFAVFHGDGLCQAMIADCAAEIPHIALAGTPHADDVRQARLVAVPEYYTPPPHSAKVYGAQERIPLSGEVSAGVAGGRMAALAR